jgi:hypothetical protein
MFGRAGLEAAFIGAVTQLKQNRASLWDIGVTGDHACTKAKAVLVLCLGALLLGFPTKLVWAECSRIEPAVNHVVNLNFEVWLAVNLEDPRAAKLGELKPGSKFWSVGRLVSVGILAQRLK